MSAYFENVDTMKYWVQKILPQAYDDSLSYQEVLYRVVTKLNTLVENSNNLPKYVQEMILAYINSGELGEVVSSILANFMLNVKNPPNNLKPATGDGTEDDTVAIQGCIDYANANGGKCVYFPSGSYLTKSLILKDNVSLAGFDRSNTRLVLSGGATQPLLSGTCSNNTISKLAFDGNMSIQVNEIDVISLIGGKYLFDALDITDGYTLMKLQLNDFVQASTLHFGKAVIDALVTNGSGNVVFDNLMIKELSVLSGRYAINNSVAGAIFKDFYSACATATAINNTADNCVFDGQIFGSTTTMNNTGKDVTYNFYKRGSSVVDEINKMVYLQDEAPTKVNANTVWYDISATVVTDGQYIFEPIG